MGFFLDVSWGAPHPCSLLSEKTSVQVSLHHRETLGLSHLSGMCQPHRVVTSMKTLDSPWLSQLPMNSDTGKEPRKLRLPLLLIMHQYGRVSGESDCIVAWGIYLLNLCFLICKVGWVLGKTQVQYSTVFSAWPLVPSTSQNHRDSPSLWVRTRWAEIRR